MLVQDQIKSLAVNIAALRRNKRLSQQEFADMVREQLQDHDSEASFFQSYVSEIENGKRDVTVVELLVMANIFGVLPSDLLRDYGVR